MQGAEPNSYTIDDGKLSALALLDLLAAFDVTYCVSSAYVIYVVLMEMCRTGSNITPLADASKFESVLP